MNEQNPEDRLVETNEPEGTPEQTDNTERPEDGEQDVDQDVNFVHPDALPEDEEDE